MFEAASRYCHVARSVHWFRHISATNTSRPVRVCMSQADRSTIAEYKGTMSVVWFRVSTLSERRKEPSMLDLYIEIRSCGNRHAPIYYLHVPTYSDQVYVCRCACVCVGVGAHACSFGLWFHLCTCHCLSACFQCACLRQSSHRVALSSVIPRQTSQVWLLRR